MRLCSHQLFFACTAILTVSSSAFVRNVQISSRISSLGATTDTNDAVAKKALKFPPLEDDEEIQKYAGEGMTPRDARIISPLQALLSMPIVLSGTAGANPAYAMDDNTFEQAVADYFPKARTSSKTLELVTEVLSRRAKREDTLYGTSICPDEVNTKPGVLSLATALQNNVSDQNGVFALGGLAGLPFVGISGMQAFLSHCPEEGRVVIFFGPHVGVSETGTVGKVARLGREKLSGACGAALGAYKIIKAEQNVEEAVVTKTKASFSSSDYSISFSDDATSADVLASRKKLIAKLQQSLDKIAEESSLIEEENAGLKKKLKQKTDTADFQEEYLINRLRNKIAKVQFEDDNRAIAYVTKQVYGFLVDMLYAELKYCWKDPSFWEGIEEVTLIGGILINRSQGLAQSETEDWFQPLKFETYTYDGGIRKLDLYGKTFGRIPFGYSLFYEDDF